MTIGNTACVLRCAASIVALTSAFAAQATQPDYQIPPEPLGKALRAFARISGRPVIAASDLVAGKVSAGASGTLSADEALSAILAGSGLHAEIVEGAFVIHSGPLAGAPDGPRTSDDIVVTGTRIHGAGPIGAPLSVIPRTAIEDSGRATVADYIATLPQNFTGGPNEGSYGTNPRAGENVGYGSSINLRGLGTESTLVLFDGNRPALGGDVGSFADMSLIPTTAIDRVEILTDGASAIYGTDAVAGVVNVRFRDHFDGLETKFYAGDAGGAYHQVQAAQAYGKRWSNGGIFLAYQYDRHSNLSGADRAVATEDLRRYGGPDLRSSFAIPGTIITANGETFAIPSGQDGHALAGADLVPGTSNLVDRRKQIDILPQQTTHSAYAALDQQIIGGFSVYARALYAHRAFLTSNDSRQLSAFTVPTTNPFYVDPLGTGEPVSVDYDLSNELGGYKEKGVVQAITTSVGIKGTIGPWHVEASGSFGRQHEIIDDLNSVSPTRADIALADTDPATALNLFGDGHANNPATLSFIRSTTHYDDLYKVWSAAFRIDGPLFDLPAGTVKLAAGAEHRHEFFSAYFDYNSYEASPDLFDHFQTPGTPGGRHVDALYAELSVPVLRSDSFPGRLDASVAARADWYSDVGRTTNPKVGLSWAPRPGITLRGSWGTSFRAPSFYENAGTASNQFVPYPAVDPSSPSGTRSVLLLDGYAPDIRPERAASWTVGIDLKPAAAPGLSISATYFDIAYRDRIASPATYLDQVLVQPDIYGSLISSATPAQIAAYYASPLFANYYGIPASDIDTIIDIRTRNLSRSHVRGVDASVGYTHELLGGNAGVDATATRLIAIDQELAAGSPTSNVVGTLYNPVKLRLRGHAGWSRGGLSADGFVNYLSGYLNNQVLPAAHVASWTTIDAQIGYRFADASPLKGARVALSATNLFNTRPPYVLYSSFGQTLAYDPGQANAIGREIAVQATFSW